MWITGNGDSLKPENLTARQNASAPSVLQLPVDNEDGGLSGASTSIALPAEAMTRRLSGSLVDWLESNDCGRFLTDDDV